MQRYSASELPQQNGSQRPPVQNGQQNAQQQAIQHAAHLGAYVLEQRGREGAELYVRGLCRVLPEAMLVPLCKHLQISLPQQREEACAASNDRPQQIKQRNEPDMEMLLKLMQLMKGNNGKDLSALMQLFGKN